jgi:hypothetical protein
LNSHFPQHTIYEDPHHLELIIPVSTHPFVLCVRLMGTFQFQVANCDLKFIPVDAHGFVCSDKSGAAIQPFAEFYPAPTALTTAENRALYKARRIEFEDNMMHTSQSYQGMFVRIVGKHSRKGLLGS